MNRAVAVVAAVAMSSLSSACASLPQSAPVVVAADADGSTAGWREESRRATRRVEPYDWANRVADLRATLVTPRLRKAFVDDRADFHGRFAADTQRELVAFGNADEGVDAAVLAGPPGDGEVLVFVAFYASDQKNRDLAVSGSIWDTSLVRGERHVRPARIDRVRLTPAVVDVFPWVDRFDDLYLMHFPVVDAASGVAVLTPGESPLRLEVHSAIAEATVAWDLRER